MNNHPLRIQAYEQLPRPCDCNMLLIGASEAGRVEVIVATMAHQPVLVFADFEGFARAGGVGNFVMVENRVRFEINNVAAREAGLKVSSRLLRVALLVE